MSFSRAQILPCFLKILLNLSLHRLLRASFLLPLFSLFLFLLLSLLLLFLNQLIMPVRLFSIPRRYERATFSTYEKLLSSPLGKNVLDPLPVHILRELFRRLRISISMLLWQAVNKIFGLLRFGCLWLS